MVKYLGRPLADDEVVHHRDGDPFHNGLGNLQVLTRKEHRKLHRHQVGERNSRAKLTQTQVDEIRASPLKQRALAELYDVSQSHISNILAGKYWKED
jgi:DNA-binding transcriptional regulator YiaG